MKSIKLEVLINLVNTSREILSHISSIFYYYKKGNGLLDTILGRIQSPCLPKRLDNSSCAE